MARGWESKAVEAQIESAEKPHKPKLELTAAQLEAARKLDGLLLHRTRVLRDLESCREARYKKQLTDGLTYLESQLAALGWHA